jgi:hypothetical protein
MPLTGTKIHLCIKGNLKRRNCCFLHLTKYILTWLMIAHDHQSSLWNVTVLPRSLSHKYVLTHDNWFCGTTIYFEICQGMAEKWTEHSFFILTFELLNWILFIAYILLSGMDNSHEKHTTIIFIIMTFDVQVWP